MTSRLADLTSIPHAQNFLAAKSHPAGRRESWRLVLLTTHSAGSESSTRSTGGGAGSKDEGGDGTDSEPVSVTLQGRDNTSANCCIAWPLDEVGRNRSRLTSSASNPRSLILFLMMIQRARSRAKATKEARRARKAVRDMRMVQVLEARATPSCKFTTSNIISVNLHCAERNEQRRC